VRVFLRLSGEECYLLHTPGFWDLVLRLAVCPSARVTPLEPRTLKPASLSRAACSARSRSSTTSRPAATRARTAGAATP
jgi:hypothetical protein